MIFSHPMQNMQGLFKWSLSRFQYTGDGLISGSRWRLCEVANRPNFSPESRKNKDEKERSEVHKCSRMILWSSVFIRAAKIIIFDNATEPEGGKNRGLQLTIISDNLQMTFSVTGLILFVCDGADMAQGKVVVFSLILSEHPSESQD